jgi:hypothetical protein
MATLSTLSPVPTKTGAHDGKILSGSVVEKGNHADDEPDTNSELKQDGVKQVEAVTQAWSPAMMWLVFALYVHYVDRSPQHTHTDNLSPDYTWSPSSTPSSKPSTAA